MTERKKIDGKSFIKALDECKGKDEVFGLLNKTMGPERMRDRAKNVSDLSSVVNLNAKVATLNTMRGHDTSNQDCMIMAAAKYLSLTGKDIKTFKAEINKYATRMEMFMGNLEHSGTSQTKENIKNITPTEKHRFL